MMKAFRERMQYLKDRERKEAMELLHKQNSQSLEMEVIDHRHRNNEKEANYNMEPIVDDHSAGAPPFDLNQNDNNNSNDDENGNDKGDLEEIEMEEMNAISNLDEVSNGNDSGSTEDTESSKKSIDPSKSSLSDSMSPSKLPGDSEQRQLKRSRHSESYQNGHAILAPSSNVT